MPDLNIKRAPAVDANQRAWSQVYDDINDIIKSVNRKSTDEGRTKGTDGRDGDIRLFKDNDSAKYFIEGKFNDGWAKRQMIFTDANESSQDEVISYASIQGFVKPDGSVPFTSPIIGVGPSNDLHLSTKKYVDDLLATEDTLSELNDTTITSVANGNMLKYDTGTNTWINFAANFITSYAVNDSYTGSSLSPTVFGLKQTGTSSVTTLRGIRSANSNMTITLVEGVSDGAYLNLNVASPTGITSVTGYAVLSDGYGSAVTGNTSLKFNDDYDTGSSTGIFFEVTDSGNDTIVTPNIVGALTDTNTTYAAMGSGNSYAAGLVLAGASSHSNSFLRKDGSWQVPVDTNNTSYSLTDAGGTSGSQQLVFSSSGTVGAIRRIVPGNNVTMSLNESLSVSEVVINASLSGATLEFKQTNPLGGNDLGYDTAMVKLIETSDGSSQGITWGYATSNNVLSITPTLVGYQASGTYNTIIGTDIDINTSGATIIDSLTMTDGVITAHGTRGLTAANVGAISTNHAANSISSTHITVLGNTSGTNSGNVCTSNHTGAGYLTGNETVTLSGDVTGSGTTSIACTVVDDSHNHIQSNVDGLSTSLAAKADLAGPTFTADINVADSIWINGYTDNTASRIRFHHNGSHAYQDWETGNYYIRYDTATKYMMDSSGNFHAGNDVYAYSTSVGSDKKLKKNIKDIKYGLSDVMKLRGVDFDWKEKRDGVHDIGVIAQEVREIIPEVVKEAEDVNGEKYLSVDYSKLVPVLIESIKELKKELDGIRKP